MHWCVQISRRPSEDYARCAFVQALVKIVKHVEAERYMERLSGIYQRGWLTGVWNMAGKRLEITNVIPAPRSTNLLDDDVAFEAEQRQ